MGLILPFPRRHRPDETERPRQPHPFRDAARNKVEATRLRLRHLIAVALEALDGLDHHPPGGEGAPVIRIRRRVRKSKTGATP